MLVQPELPPSAVPLLSPARHRRAVRQRRSGHRPSGQHRATTCTHRQSALRTGRDGQHMGAHGWRYRRHTGRHVTIHFEHNRFRDRNCCGLFPVTGAFCGCAGHPDDVT